MCSRKVIAGFLFATVLITIWPASTLAAACNISTFFGVVYDARSLQPLAGAQVATAVFGKKVSVKSLAKGGYLLDVLAGSGYRISASTRTHVKKTVKAPRAVGCSFQEVNFALLPRKNLRGIQGGPSIARPADRAKLEKAMSEAKKLAIRRVTANKKKFSSRRAIRNPATR